MGVNIKPNDCHTCCQGHVRWDVFAANELKNAFDEGIHRQVNGGRHTVEWGIQAHCDVHSNNHPSVVGILESGFHVGGVDVAGSLSQEQRRAALSRVGQHFTANYVMTSLLCKWLRAGRCTVAAEEVLDWSMRARHSASCYLAPLIDIDLVFQHVRKTHQVHCWKKPMRQLAEDVLVLQSVSRNICRLRNQQYGNIEPVIDSDIIVGTYKGGRREHVVVLLKRHRT